MKAPAKGVGSFLMLPTVQRPALSVGGTPVCPICDQPCSFSHFPDHVRYVHGRRGQYGVVTDHYVIGEG